jgi:4-diphosphocytidyl-2-C-methyl-D-erythritol kinase
VTELTLESPAKINLFLAVTGRRPDGYHDLVSLVAPMEWGDTLHVAAADEFSIECSDVAVPKDASNLVLKAAAAFRRATGFRGGAKFTLTKQIPIGAGLGGGSSNAAAALKALNQLAGNILDDEALKTVAATVGSDCPLFLQASPVIMRGRGEQLERVKGSAGARIRGTKLLVFKPAFGISTPWAYLQMIATAPSSYIPPEHAEAKLAAWLDGSSSLAELLFNNMEGPAFRKFPALPALLDQLYRTFGVVGRMSGSGSACFALLPDEIEIEVVKAAIRAAWGESAFVVQTRLA